MPRAPARPWDDRRPAPVPSRSGPGFLPGDLLQRADRRERSPRKALPSLPARPLPARRSRQFLLVDAVGLVGLRAQLFDQSAGRAVFFQDPGEFGAGYGPAPPMVAIEALYDSQRKSCADNAALILLAHAHQRHSSCARAPYLEAP